MTKINLGRVQGVSAFYSTSNDQNANLPLNQIKPSQIKPFVGDYIIFSNGNIRAIEQIANEVAVCGDVLFSLKGEAGFGLSKIEQTIADTNGGTNIIRFTLEDGTPFDVQIKNGRDGIDGTNGKDGKDGANGKDGKDGIDGTNGKDGVGISSILKTNTNGNVDTYTIALTNGNNYTFSVANGKDGVDGLSIVSVVIEEVETHGGGEND